VNKNNRYIDTILWICRFLHMEKWRVLIHGTGDAFTNMAIDEALLISGKPTLRLYRWKPSAISIGYFQSMEEEVNLEECTRQGIDVVRRITGGGAVYHDERGEITYSLVCPQQMVPVRILDSYRLICTSLAGGLGVLGIEAHHAGINDIVVNGKKISGSAQTRRYGNVLQHGTILISVDVKKMFSLLKVGPEKISDKGIASAEERVTSIEREVGSVDERELMEALLKGFQDVMGLSFHEGALDTKEREMAEEVRKKYVSREWNFKR